MLKKSLLISLVCIGVIAFMVGQASAGCSSNPRWCCTCLPGSLLCKAMSTGLGPIYKECIESAAENDCPAGSLTIFGTYRQVGKKFVEDISYCSNFDPTDRSTWKDCSIAMIIDCENPDPQSPKKPQGVATPYNYPFPMESGGTAFSCDSNGNCKEYYTFEPDVPEDVCKQNWTQIGTGRITRYIQSGDFCVGGWVCPEGTESAGGGAQCCFADDIDETTGRCPTDKEVLVGRICCGEAGRDEGGACLEENYGYINGVYETRFIGGPTRVFEVCTYVDPPEDPTDADAYYDCKPCTPKTWDASVLPARVTDWTCPNN